MLKNEKLKILIPILGNKFFIKSDEVVFVCPKKDCRKDKLKLSINLLTDTFHCWICGFKGKSLFNILKLGSSKNLNLYLNKNKQIKVSDIKQIKHEIPVLPDEFITLSKYSLSPYYTDAMKYLLMRNVKYSDILKLKLGYCEDGEYKYRIIFPSFDNSGKLNFFVGRSFYNNIVSYKHGNFSKDIIFNDLTIDWNKPITITEGPFDAINAGDNAIPLQGSFLNKKSSLFKKIVSSNIEVYVALDLDAINKQFNIVKLLHSYGIICYNVDIGNNKDVGEMTRLDFIQAKKNAKKIHLNSDLLKLRVSL